MSNADQSDDAPKEGLIHLDDLSFNFEQYFEQYKAGDLSQQERDEFQARILGMFCRDIFDEKKPPDWVLQYMANQLCWVLTGKPWNDAFPLPWNPKPEYESRAERDSIEIFCDIANFHKDNPEIPITKVIEIIADKHCASKEKARAAWYLHRDKIGLSKKSRKI